MPTYKAKFGDQVISVTADSPEQAALMARLKFAGMQGVQQAEAGAMERSQPEPFSPMESTGSVFADSALAGMSGEGGAFADPNATGGDILKRGASMAALASGPALIPKTGAAALGLAKDAAIYGVAEGAEKLLDLPSWTGEAIGAVKPAAQMGRLGKRLLGGLMGGAKKAAVETAASPGAAAAAARRLELDLAEREANIATKQAQAQAIAARDARAAKALADREARAAELHAARLEALKQKAALKPGPKLVPDTPKAAPPPTSGANALKPEPDVLPEEAVSLVAEPLPFKPKGQTRLPTVYTKGPAKPGPAPTPPDKLEETLRASIEAAKAKKPSPATVEKALTEAAQELTDEGLRIPRIQVGAQRVGRQVGMTKEAVRQATGPVLNEARGEASPIFPRQTLNDIIDKMLTMKLPDGSPDYVARAAYVKRANSDKAMWQVETFHRVLQKLGLLLPAGVAAGTMNTE